MPNNVLHLVGETQVFAKIVVVISNECDRWTLTKGTKTENYKSVGIGIALFLYFRKTLKCVPVLFKSLFPPPS